MMGSSPSKDELTQILMAPPDYGGPVEPSRSPSGKDIYSTLAARAATPSPMPSPSKASLGPLPFPPNIMTKIAEQQATQQATGGAYVPPAAPLTGGAHGAPRSGGKCPARTDSVDSAIGTVLSNGEVSVALPQTVAGCGMPLLDLTR
jgi:hypothetical protein